MTERRFSSSSMVPTLRSMNLQPHFSAEIAGLMEPGLAHPTTLDRKSSSSSAAEDRSAAVLLPKSPPATLDSDDFSTSSSQDSQSFLTTIESIQTLPVLDRNPLQNSEATSSNHCLVRYILPSCNSTCTIPSAPLPAVLYSIADFLRLQSIPCTLRASSSTVAFSCARSSALANLGGPSLVFIIYLWYDAPEKQNIIVDVQRRQGCLLDLQCIRRALFRTLSNHSTGATAAPVGKRQGMIPLDICRSIWATYYSSGKGESVCATEDKLDATSVDSESEDWEQLSYYRDLLAETNSAENHRMGLECLAQHTDASMTDVQRSKAVVHAIVRGVEDDRKPIVDDLRASLLRFLSAREMEQVTLPRKDQHSIHVQTNTGCSYLNMHALVLKVLTNSVHVYIDTERQEDWTVDDDFWRTVLRACRRNITTVAQAPCVAAISMHLMTILLTTNEKNRAVVLDLGRSSEEASSLGSDIAMAHAWGQLHHSKLEQAAQAFMNALQNDGKNNR